MAGVVRGLLPSALGLVLLVSACGTPQTEADSLTAPELGACRTLDASEVDLPANASAVVECTEPHTAETFLVGRLPASTGSDYDDPRHGAYAYQTCAPGFAAYLAADASLVLRMQLSWAWFRPSERGWDQGARWFRCDVIGGPADASALRNLPETTRGLFSKDDPDAWMTCARGDSVAAGTKVSCDRPHDWRAVTTVKLGEPEDPYPGDRLVQVTTRDYCQSSIGGWLGYPPDYEFGFTWFREDRWKAGNRRSLCWARTAR